MISAPEQREVRSLGPDDLPAVLALVAACSEAPAWPDAAWRSFLEDARNGPVQRKAFGGRASGNTLAGVLLMTLLDGTTELEWVGVDPVHRRSGWARLLIQRWLAWAAAAGAERALLEVRASNAAALKLYRSLGFVEEGRRPGYYQRPSDDAVLMGKALQSEASVG